jgi:competence protein ComEC
VGADAGVVRAAFMGGLALFGWQIGRKGSGLNTLAITTAVMALFDPYVLWDIGFRLSFAATLGLVLYAEPLAQWFIDLIQRWTTEDRAEKLAGPVGEYLLFTLAANITTIPLILLYSGGISLLSPLVNLLILPVQPAIMVFGGIAMLSGSLLPLVGRLLAYLAWPFAFYTIRIVEYGNFRAVLPFDSTPEEL